MSNVNFNPGGNKVIGAKNPKPRNISQTPNPKGSAMGPIFGLKKPGSSTPEIKKPTDGTKQPNGGSIFGPSKDKDVLTPAGRLEYNP